jgi:hypothetical protein
LDNEEVLAFADFCEFGSWALANQVSNQTSAQQQANFSQAEQQRATWNYTKCKAIKE